MSYERESLVAIIVALWITLFLSIVYNILSLFKINLLQEEFFYKIEWHLLDQIFFALNYSLSSSLMSYQKTSKFKVISKGFRKYAQNKNISHPHLITRCRKLTGIFTLNKKTTQIFIWWWSIELLIDCCTFFTYVGFVMVFALSTQI